MRVGSLFFLCLCLAPAVAADERGYVGFVPSFAARPAKGIAIERVHPGSPADKAGLKAGDILLKYDGQDVPNAKDYDDESTTAFPGAFLKIAQQVKVGAEVEMVVERDGRPLTLKAVAIDEAAMKKLIPEEEEEEGCGEEEGEEGESAMKLPDPGSAGAPAVASFDFNTVPEGKLPEAFFPFGGRWRIVPEEGSRNLVLLQDKPVQPWAVCVVAGKGGCYADGVATVRFQPVSGSEDASGGIVFRAQDARNYYVVRANALEGNLRIHVIKDGNRTQLASANVEAPALKKWHTLEVSFTGPAFKATLDGKDVVEAKDETFLSGWCGLWTKADSVTLFDDFAVKNR